ncbi:MAG: putative HNHc nuclease [Liquorilactobacillus nagelii]|jgi:hypothetical protein|uniref:putative HNHc nuclease n=1 Tax=Liquorilactobacillus nagelii TaxID=82688 RepID=UPI00242F5F22|nr:putative HNHc nuclease [Liquorilactobacillus nagelii]MCI1634540.1 putative HNHc nuclease [Liquorilactobacillus nagelii]
MNDERFAGHLLNVKNDEITLRVDDIEGLKTLFRRGKIDFDLEPHSVELISPLQQRKAYAMIRDIGEYQGFEQRYEFENLKQHLKSQFCHESSYRKFSLSNCHKDIATEFISWLVEYCFYFGIPFEFKDLANTFDTGRQVYLCLVHKRCTCCGSTRNIQINHEDTVGIGNDRTHLDHRGHRLEALCNLHHHEFHQLGPTSFAAKWHFHGVKLNDDQLVSLKLMSRKQMQEFDLQYEQERFAEKLRYDHER